jgi:hypothetical protein
MKDKMSMVTLFAVVVILGSCASSAALNAAVLDLAAGIPIAEQCELGIIESIGLTQIDSTPIRTIWGNAVITIPSGHHRLVYDYSNNTWGSARNLRQR